MKARRVAALAVLALAAGCENDNGGNAPAPVDRSFEGFVQTQVQGRSTDTAEPVPINFLTLEDGNEDGEPRAIETFVDG